MSYDETLAHDVTVTPRDAEVVVSWHSAAPPGTFFQVYVDGAHAWSGTALSTTLPRPILPGTRYNVGAVGPGESLTDFASSIPFPPGGGRTITLSWQGGTFLDPDIAGFYVYLGTTPGGAVNYSAKVATIAAYSQGLISDGWSCGGWSSGSFGHAGAKYSWTSGRLATGTWNAAVVSFDKFGNLGTPITASATVAGPPTPIPRATNGKRVAVTINRGTPGGWSASQFGQGGFGSDTGFGDGGWGVAGFGVGGGIGIPYATLSWLASPS